jgi:hypothetical protein
VLRAEGDQHRWKLRFLRLVDGDCVSWGDFIEFPEIVFHHFDPVIEADGELPRTILAPGSS